MGDQSAAAPLSEAGGVLTRRRFFEGLAAFGGVSLAMAGMDALGFGFASARTAPPKLEGDAKGTKVVVLGAGLAGMTAAYELTKAGYQVQVIEARSFAGGRCQTARKGFQHTDLVGNNQTCEFDEGLYINHGPWRIPYHHRSTLHYTKLFGVQLESFVNDNDAAYVYFEKGDGPLAGKPIRKGQIAADVRGYAAEMIAKAASKGQLDAPLTAADRDLFVAYMINEGRLSPTDLAYTGTEGRGFDVHPGAGVDPGPGKPSTPYSLSDVLHSNAWRVLSSVSGYEQQRTMLQPVGGMDQIAKGFEKRVGTLIRYSCVVDKIKQGPKGVVVTYTDKFGEQDTITADYCVCTIPLSVLKNIDADFSKPFKAAMSGVAYAPVNKIGLQMKTRFWEENHHIYGGHIYNDMPGIGTITLPSTGWQGQKGVLLGYYAFGGEAAKISAKPPAERAAFAVAAGQKIFPEYAENFENAFSFSWHLAPFNLGGWAEWGEEGRKAAYPVLCEPDGRIYLAGEHLTYLGGWQAGAIESAWQQIGKLHARVLTA
ncbi:flavin monoamine oxidase family protein [Caulobacter rhizosphaerae]|jgi:monoamine oxidase|uniref:flavin monoamine oxidase family protein n=1 Tax=Caulobacter rhizosphaerae TaxID=2010972 RepID=UPI0013D1CE06|nr:flavin monoamine oxidase family protein [Caulobacter rhizosphaerae]GGL30189.1 monoamine oxidase [Caulobacter rhizosphaerae]